MEGFGFTNDWSLCETEVLECTLSQLNLDRPDWMEVVAARLPNKTVDQVRERYMDLLMAMECLSTESPPQPNYTDLLMAGDYQEPLSPALPDFASPSTYLAPSPALPDFGSLSFTVPSPAMTGFGSPSYMQPGEGSSTSSVDFMLSPPATDEEIMMLSSLLTEEMKLPSETVAKGSEEPILVEHEEVAWSPPVTVAPPIETVWSPPVVVTPPAEMVRPPPRVVTPLSEMVWSSPELVWSSPAMVENEMETSQEAAEMEIPMSPPLMFDADNDAPLANEEGAQEENNAPPPTGVSTKGLPWTEEEHRLFLIGMDVHGRGNWRGIAKNFVITRSSTQVASHAQKYFNRRMEFKQKRRPSIHDITSFGGRSHRKPDNLSLYDIAHWNKSFRIPRINSVYQAGPSTASPLSVNNRPRPYPRVLVPNSILGDGVMRSAPAPKNRKGKQPYDPYAPSSSKK